MNTITLWLLISVGSSYHQNTSPSVTVAHFASSAECQRVSEQIRDARDYWKPVHRCIEAKIVKP